MFFDICIIGGGAAGLMAAVTAKQKNKKLNIALLERLDRVGKKIAVTGNGRCNITNRNITLDRYHGKDVKFADECLKEFGTQQTCLFFEQLGVPLIFEGDKAYPRSLQAASVTDALRFRANELGISMFFEKKVEKMVKNGNGFLIDCGETFTAKTVIVAAGLLSGGVKLGCDGQMLEVLKPLGLKVVPPAPAIVQLKTDTDFVRQLKGIKVDAQISLIRNGKAVKNDEGEVLFCDYGLSGPPVLQLSGRANKGDTVSLDLVPEYDFSSLTDMLLGRTKTLFTRKNDEFLSGLINKRLGQVVIKRAGLSLSGDVSTLNLGEIKKICRVLKDFSFTVTGNTGFVNSQVSKGGLETSQFDSRTLMCKKCAGLFAAGEILDIDGDCGGFNLQWAWASGYAAACGAVEFLSKK